MNWITPFCWTDESGQPHFDCQRLLQAVGLDATNENLELAAQALVKNLQELWPDTTVFVRTSIDPRVPRIPAAEFLEGRRS